jgi:hypothetical protein
VASGAAAVFRLFFPRISRWPQCVGVSLGMRHQHPDPPHPARLLCVRGERPHHHRATEKRDEVATSHVPALRISSPNAYSSALCGGAAGENWHTTAPQTSIGLEVRLGSFATGVEPAASPAMSAVAPKATELQRRHVTTRRARTGRPKPSFEHSRRQVSISVDQRARLLVLGLTTPWLGQKTFHLLFWGSSQIFEGGRQAANRSG